MRSPTLADDDERWEVAAARLVRVEMARRGVKQTELADRLSQTGSVVTAASLRSKLSRGTFTAAFLLRVLDALGCMKVDVGQVSLSQLPDQ